jgi:hypothetical protein
MVHPRRGPAPARPFRGRRVEGEGIPALPARGAARQDRGRGQLQGRCGQDLDRGASGDVGGARRLPGAGGRSRQPGLDDLDLRGPVEDEWQTVFPLLARHYAASAGENQARQGRGEAPQPGRDAERGAGERLCGPDPPTHWPNIDLIGAQLDLYWAEFQIPSGACRARLEAVGCAGDRLEADGVLDDYDIVILDTPPCAGYLTINALAAADILLVPLGASFLEFDSTGRFFDMLHATFRRSRRARTWPPAPWGAKSCASNGTRCARC